MTLIVLQIPGSDVPRLDALARRQFHPREIYLLLPEHAAGFERALALLPALGGSLALVAGDASFGLHRHLQGARYVTLLRDPIPRVVSRYRDARHDTAHPMHPIASSMTLSEVLERDAWRDLSNGECRALTGRWEFSADDQPSQVLELAVDNLERHFALWGLTERFPETALIARATLGWRHITPAAAGPTERSDTAEASDADLEAVAHYNALDIALRAELEARFQQRLVEAVPDWERRLVRLRAAGVAAGPARRLQGHHKQTMEPSARQAPQVSDDAAGAEESLRRWMVGGYDWQAGRKEGRHRRIADEYNWSRIESSFAFLQRVLLPCDDLGGDAAYDVGSGAGLVSFALLGHFASVVGVDSDPRAIARARLLAAESGITGARFIHRDVTAFEPGATFDLVLCNLMSHNVPGRLALLRRLASATKPGGWLIYAEEAHGYPPLEIERAIAERNARALRARLRQLVSGVLGEPSFRFFVAPTVNGPLESLGYEVVEQDISWWHSLPASHRVWCRKRSDVVGRPEPADPDYDPVPTSLARLRSRAHELVGDQVGRNGALTLTPVDELWMADGEDDLAPLLLLIEMAANVLPTGRLAQVGALSPAARRVMDSAAGRSLDWRRVEDGFARFCALVEARGAPAAVASQSKVEV